MTTEASAAATNQDAPGNTSEMADPNAGLVDLDKGQGLDGAQPGEGGDGGDGNGEGAAIDDARARIYAKHAERRQEQLAQNPAEEDPNEEITVKVNGRERQVPRSKVDAAGGIEAYQKNAAASEMLNQASAEARRVREQAEALAIRERDIAEREERLKQAAAAKPTSPTELPADAGALKSMARQYHEAMLDGDIDKADELLLQINAAQGSNATAVNPEEIANRAVQRAREELTADERRKVAEKFEADRQAAVAAFSVKHKDLASNPDAFGLVDAKTLEVHREHPDWSAAAIIDEAASRVRSLIKSVATPSTTSAKLEAKRNMTQIRGGSARTVPTPGPVPQTKSSYVADLRRQRGLDT